MVLAKLKAEAARLGVAVTVAHSRLLAGYIAVSHRGHTTECPNEAAALAQLRDLAAGRSRPRID